MFIKLHDIYDKEYIVNMDNVTIIRPRKFGGAEVGGTEICIIDGVETCRESLAEIEKIISNARKAEEWHK